MSISLDTAGALVLKSSGTGANSYSMTISCPIAVTANRAISIVDPGVNCSLAYNSIPLASTIVAAGGPSAAQSGFIVPVSHNGAAGALTLPAASVGLNYKVVCTVAGAKDITVTPTGADTFYGYLIGAATPVACANKATIVLTAAKALVGDSLDIFCALAGSWQVRGTSATAGYFA